jgi:NAD(P)-dependent dehydrogenase (short-subunit alcohol dehydrogenase family)
MTGPLTGKIALVAGATRGAGRGIAAMLGEAGATVICTGRSSRGDGRQVEQNAVFDLSKRPEVIEGTAEMVTERGGVGIAIRVDHSDEVQVRALIERIKAEHGRLDILVNDIWGGGENEMFGKMFWKMDIADGHAMFERAIWTHLITAKYAIPLMIESKSGLIVEIGDGDNYDYRGAFYYDLVKVTVMRIAHNFAEELRPLSISAVAVTPGFLRSEAMLEHFGVTEANWRDGVKTDPHFIASETPYFVGRAVAALAADPNVAAKSGKTFASWTLSDEYGFSDINGERPHWGRYFKEHVLGEKP